MTALDINERTVEELIDEVRQHPSYRPEINSETEAFLALNGLPPFTYMIRKGENNLRYFVSFVTDEHAVISEGFWIIEEKRLFQYRNFGLSSEDKNQANEKSYELFNGMLDNSQLSSEAVYEDPYFLKYFSDLDDIIFLAAMKCEKNKTQTLV